jgi:hypothetical protein
MSLLETNLEVLRCWLLAKVPFPAAELWTSDAFRSFISRQARRVRSLSNEKLEAELEHVGDEERQHRFRNWNWTKRIIPLSEFGPWRTVQGLPQEACHNSAIEAADFVRRHDNSMPNCDDCCKQKKYRRTVERIRRLESVADVIRSEPLLSVLVAAKPQRGREGCRQLSYSSEDGSHRAIALALIGYDMVQAWVGMACTE